MIRGRENKIYKARLSEQAGVVLAIENKTEKGDSKTKLSSLLIVKKLWLQQDLGGRYK